MKKLITSILVLFIGLNLKAQVPVATYELKTDNFKQLNETTISWEMWMKKSSGVDFGLYGWQLQWEFDAGVQNGGQFQWADFTISAGADGNVFAGHYNNADATVPGLSYFNYATSQFPNIGENMTLITSDWKHIATFTAQLSKTGNPHNFASVAINFAHRTGGVFQVLASTIPHATGNNGLISGTLTTAQGEAISNRELASHWFSGSGSWTDAARWNNVTTENANTVPGSGVNVGISGTASISDARTLNEVTVAEGGLLLLSETSELTADLVFNENSGAPATDVTVALWDFEAGEGGNLPYTADQGNAANAGIAAFSTTANDNGILDAGDLGITGGTVGPFADVWRGGLPATQKAWVAQFSSAGIENLKLSSIQWSDINNEFGSGVGPNSFSLQYSFDNSSWTTITTITVSNDLNTGVLADLALPSALDNQAVVYLRWRTNATDNTKNGFSFIDNVVIVGDEKPAGITLLSSASGTGSLIHNNTGVAATVQRYMPGAVSAWHSISAPVGDMLITGSDWDPAADEDLYLWDEASYQWVNFKNQDGSGGNPSWPVANGNNNFTTGRGYIANYNTADVTHSFSGTLNAGTVNINLAYSASGWNLVGNPYASGLNFNTIGKTNLAENYAQVYDPNYGGGAGGYVTATNIAPGQGFFVMASAAGSLAMDTDDQVHAGTFYKGVDAEVAGELVLMLKQGDFYDETSLQVLEGSEAGHDYYDATKLYSFNQLAPQFATIIEGRQLAINSIPELDPMNTVFLQTKLQDALVSTISAEYSGIFQQEQIILKDNLTGIQHDLKESPYEFLSGENDENRFQLLFNPVGQNEILSGAYQIYYGQGNVVIKSENGLEGALHIFDLTGRLISSAAVTTDTFQQIAVNLDEGLYLVMIEDKEGHKYASKIIVN